MGFVFSGFYKHKQQVNRHNHDYTGWIISFQVELLDDIL